ncbi:uncharacterized protein LOC135081014 [Ostrinia nubilalis]|uniref:uncharacterized protein LOC135081014 n=1 Tax=Ostrinia nubilalis TaxID=29057 RepID=UPI0030822799
MDGSEVRQQLVDALVGMGYSRRLAAHALRNSNNHVAEAVRLIQEQPELLQDSDLSSEETEPSSSDDSLVVPDEKLVEDLVAMGYDADKAKLALRVAKNQASFAVELLVAGANFMQEDPANPSTSSGAASKKRQKRRMKEKKKREREQAWKRLSSALRADEEAHLDTSLAEEEEFLAQYKSLL